jgi:hypothetical protein
MATARASTCCNVPARIKACALFFCIDDRDLDAETLAPVRQAFPFDAKSFARAYDRRQMPWS